MTYRDIGISHAAATINVILAHDAIAVLDALMALETTDIADMSTQNIGRVVGIENVDARTSLVLRVLVRREEFDGIVEAGGSDSRLIWMGCSGMLDVINSFQCRMQTHVGQH